MRRERLALSILGLILAILFVILLPPRGQTIGEQTAKSYAEQTDPGQFALLVGTTIYPNLDRDLWLDGGANDVLLMKHVLVNKYGFAEKNIRILSEAEGVKDSKRWPTRRNIERECLDLARKTTRGNKVVVLLCGHGCRQPESKDTQDPQPDGMDKIYLPRDVNTWNGKTGKVPGAIKGKELGDWLRPVVDKEASLWVIVDACHSGSGLRGPGEKPRKIEAEKDLKIPATVIAHAEKRAAQLLKGQEKTGGTVPPFSISLAQRDNTVLTYACLSWEVTVEGYYAHPVTNENKPHGLLTHTICSVLLAASAPLTYRELMIRVQNKYTGDGRVLPTPVIEGRLQNAIVLGRDELSRPNFILSREGAFLRVNAGQLHGLTLGSVLGVYPPAGDKGDLKGYVKIVKLNLVTAECVPTEFKQVKPPEVKKLEGGRCEIAEIAYDGLGLTVAVDRTGSSVTSAGDSKALDRLASDLEAIAREEKSPIEYVHDQGRATWLVRLEEGKVYLLPRSESLTDQPTKYQRVLGPAPAGENRISWMTEALKRIIRAQNLLTLANQNIDPGIQRRRHGDACVQVKIERLGQQIEDSQRARTVPTFYYKDEVQFVVNNLGKIAVDVTILHVNSKFGIVPLFPTAGGGEFNRVEPGSTPVRSPVIRVDEKTRGLEHVVVIAVKAQQELMDFSALGQSDIEGARELVKSSLPARTRALASDLGRLLMYAMYQDGNASRMSPREIEEYCMFVIPVRIDATTRPTSEG